MRSLLLAGLFATALGGCVDRAPMAYGDANSIIVLARGSTWEQVSDTVTSGLEPRVFTVRRERIFQLTQIEPSDQKWNTLRQFRQILVIGRPSDPWIEDVRDEAEGPVGEPPTVFAAEDVWVRGQLVVAMVLPEDADMGDVDRMLPEVREIFDARFREYAGRRMFSSGVDSALADTLRAEGGFSLLVPQVYEWTRRDSFYLFRNDASGADELVRSILVTWREGADRAVSAEDVLAWRDTLATQVYQRPMTTQREEVRVDTVQSPAGPVVEVRGIWSSPPGEYPGAGPFIDRVVYCPAQDRTYFLDAWLYAPGLDKYEYMLQLWTILNTFRCGEAAAERVQDRQAN